MSKWTLVYDFYDFLEIGNIFESEERFHDLIENFEIYHNYRQIQVSDISDFIPYYTHLIEDIEDNKITLSKLNYFEIEEHDGFLKQDTVERAVECDNFVRENGKEMFWTIPLERRLKYEKCPLGDVFFCELNIKKNNLSKSKNKMCPFMYSRRKMPCQLEKYKDRIELMDAQKISRKEAK